MRPKTVRLQEPVGTQSLGVSPEWMTEGICNQVDPELFYPEPGGACREAKRVCMACPIQQRCLDWALKREELHGIWGGFTVRERGRMQRGLPPNRARSLNPIVDQLDDPSRDDPRAHGFMRYRRGCRCETCTEANTAHHRLYRESIGRPQKLCQTCGKEVHGKGRHKYCSSACKGLAYSGHRKRKDDAA